MSASTSTALACAAALSTREKADEALQEVLAAAREPLGGPPHLALLFSSPHHASHLERLATDACELLGTRNLLGCTGESIVGTGQEVEESPALSLWLARW